MKILWLHLGLHKKKGFSFYFLKPLILLVGATGFEPVTLCL